MSAAQPFTVGELNKILEYFKTKGNIRNYTLIFLGCNTALRVGDLLSLSVGDVAIPVKGGFKIRNQIRLKEQKTGKHRTIYLNNPSVIYRLHDYLKTLPHPIDYDAPLFRSQLPNEEGSLPSIGRKRAWQMIKLACLAIGIDDFGKSTHSMRKTFVRSCIDQGFSVDMIQKLLGHSSQLITLAYAGITEDDVKDMYKRVRIGVEKRKKKSDL